MITEDELTAMLSRATADVEPAPVRVEELIGAGLRTRRRSRALYAGSVAAVAVVLTAGAALVHPWTGHTEPTRPAAGGDTCLRQVPVRELPDWARAGFNGQHPTMPYVLGREGRLAALIFAQPLTAPPPTDGRNNKILWVVKPAETDLRHTAGGGNALVIHAHLVDGSASVVRTVDGGPGPSIVDLPEAGCWRLDLTFGGLSDSMDLYYAAG